MIKLDISDRIDKLLKERGISRRKLAILAEVPPSSFQSAMERGGNMTTEMLQKIAHALGVSAGYLMGWEELDSNTWGKEASDEAYIKLAENIEKFHGAKAKMNTAFDRLNEAGQQKAVERVEELAEIPKYQKKPGTE